MTPMALALNPPSRMGTPIRAAKAHVRTNRPRVRPWPRCTIDVCCLILRRLANLDSAERCRQFGSLMRVIAALEIFRSPVMPPPPPFIFATQIFRHASKTLV